LVFLYLGAMIVLFVLNLKAVFEPPLLLLILNTTFAGLIPIAVSIIAARGYLFSGLNSLLFMGCGMMTFGCGAAMSGWLLDGQQVPNVNVTIMNVGALLGSAFHAVGAILAWKKSTSETKPDFRKSQLVLAYAGMFLVVLGCTLATRRGLTPAFFIQGAGPTLLRQFVLATAVLLFLLSALVSLSLFTKGRRPFHYWYALSLIMIALGLTAFFIQKSVGSPIGWLGRSGEYLGSFFALIAILGIVRSARFKRVIMPIAVTELFQNADVGYQALLETVADPIVAFERDGKIVLWNSAAETTFGCRNQEALGASLFHLVIGEASRASFRAQIDGLIAPGNPGPGRLSLEIAGKAKDGRAIPLEVSSSARMGAKGQWLFVSVFRDISERQAAAAKLRALNESLERRVEEGTRAVRESEFRWHFAIEGSGDGLWDWNVPAGTVFFSPRWKAMLGFADDEIGDRLEEWSKRVHPGDLARVMAEVQTHLAGTTPLYASEHRVSCKDGSWKWIMDRGMVVSRDAAGKPLRLIGTHKDITERKEAENKVRQSHDLLANLARLVPGVVYQYRLFPDGRSAFPYSSPGMNDIYEVTPAEVREDATPVFGRLHPDDYGRVGDLIQESARTLRTFYCEFRVILPRQGLRWRWSQAQPERMGDGGTLWHGIICDITERKQAEAALRQKAEALRASNAELEQFNRAMVGRELRMIELKQEINELCRRLGEPPRQDMSQLQTEHVPGARPAPAPPGGGSA
jgi:PAS domain S-box-containing protein